MAQTIFILNGPNLNLLGTREPHLYGNTTLADVKKMCVERGKAHGLKVDLRQTNYEGQMVDWIHEAIKKAEGIIINAAALTHTSVATLDALKNFKGPIVELHITNPHQRESFRHLSYITYVATAMMSGFGPEGYPLAVDGIAMLLKKRKAV
ncbi:MAG: type II 3-dehydroquinate dehydratase [Alphaproteobacteria bacterium]|nr:type II 3-dehydroquinate dehydratase [Alphaproteobacteria bacterium]